MPILRAHFGMSYLLQGENIRKDQAAKNRIPRYGTPPEGCSGDGRLRQALPDEVKDHERRHPPARGSAEERKGLFGCKWEDFVSTLTPRSGMPRTGPGPPGWTREGLAPAGAVSRRDQAPEQPGEEPAAPEGRVLARPRGQRGSGKAKLGQLQRFWRRLQSVLTA